MPGDRINSESMASICEVSKMKFREIIFGHGLNDLGVSVRVKALTPEEAIGEPGRRDFPIITGKETVIEASIPGAVAHAYTDSPGEFEGKLSEILNLPLTANKRRAIYIASLNAALRYLNLIEKTIHCRDEEPENCAKAISAHIQEMWGKVNVGLIGLNPAIAATLVDTFGKQAVLITDLNKQNIKCSKYGVPIWDGNAMTGDLIEQSDVILITGTTFVNSTFDYILSCIQKYGKNYLVYGVTGAGICKLMGLNRICPYGRN